MRARKTFNVEEFRISVNKMLAESKTKREYRIGMYITLENLLFETGNYHGYNHLRQSDVPAGELPGIIFDESENRDHKYPDDSRRVYY